MDFSKAELSRTMNRFLNDGYVFIIDPSSNYRASLKQFLKNLKVQNICTCSTTKDAKRQMIGKKVKLIISEWLIDEENGLQFCRQLQKSKEHRQTPFLLLGGESLQRDVILASEVDITGYLLKPISYEAFCAKLMEVIRFTENPTPLSQILSEGEHALFLEDLNLARDLFLKAKKIAPKSAKACTGLGKVSLKQGDISLAIQHLEEAQIINPKYLDSYRILLEIHEQENNIQESIHLATILHEKSPENPRYSLKLATLHLSQEDLDLSEDFFKKTIKISPSLAGAYKGLGQVALKKGNPQKAAKLFQKALDIEDQDVSSLNSLGLAYVKMGLFSEGVKKYLIALSLQPDDPRILFNLGYAYEKQDRMSEAVNYYEKAIALDIRYEKAQRGIDRLQS